MNTVKLKNPTTSFYSQIYNPNSQWNRIHKIKDRRLINKYTEKCKGKNKKRNNGGYKRGQFASQSRMRASDIDSKFHSYGISAAPSDPGISPANNIHTNA